MEGRGGGIPPLKKVRKIVTVTPQMLEKLVPESPHITFGALSPGRPHRGAIKVSHDNVPIAVQKDAKMAKIKVSHNNVQEKMQRWRREHKRKCYRRMQNIFKAL